MRACPCAGPVGRTGVRLAEAIGDIAIVRALHRRWQFVDQQVARAWRDGIDICLVGSAAADAVGALCGRDLSNVTRAVDLSALRKQRGATYDFICAADIADTSDASALKALFAALRQRLAPGGTAMLSALLPHHIGAGWAQTCLNWRPRQHSGPALLRLAAAARLEAQIFNDETNCIVWCVLRRASGSDRRGLAE